VPFFPTTFLPPFNEGTLLIGLRLNPGVTLTETSALARQAEVLIKQVPEVTHVGRRSGRAELDEHAEGVHVSELDVGSSPPPNSRAHGRDQGRHPFATGQPARCARDRPADLAPHRPHAVGRALADRDQDLRRGPRRAARPGRCIARQAGHHPGIADLQIEKQVLAPQIKVRIDYAAAAQYGVPAPQVLNALQASSRARRSRRSSRAAAASRWW
jgi:HME family heavy-metal exporter